ncbi:MAG: preprotein translocase subunit SecG [Parcubacteria group bacterium]
MTHILPYIQIILSFILIAGILLQRSETGLGSAFGSDTTNTRYARRGLEKVLFHTTIIVAILFAASALASLILG